MWLWLSRWRITTRDSACGCKQRARAPTRPAPRLGLHGPSSDGVRLPPAFAPSPTPPPPPTCPATAAIRSAAPFAAPAAYCVRRRSCCVAAAACRSGRRSCRRLGRHPPSAAVDTADSPAAAAFLAVPAAATGLGLGRPIRAHPVTPAGAAAGVTAVAAAVLCLLLWLASLPRPPAYCLRWRRRR